MAGVTVAALRHRPRQALLVLLLSVLVGASAVLGPLYARAVEQSVLRNVVSDADVAERVLVVTGEGVDAPSPRRLERTAAQATPSFFGRGVGGASASVLFGDAEALFRARLVSREGVCEHLTVSTGRCLQRRGEVLLSRRASETTGIGVGDRLVPRSEAASGAAAPVTDSLLVVGTYDTVDATADYWAGRGRQAPPPPRPAQRDESQQRAITVDDLVTTWPTLHRSGWPDLQTFVDIPLRPQAVDLTRERSLEGATAEVDAQVSAVGGSARSELGSLLERSTDQREQAGDVIPVLAVQLAVLGVVVLAFVCAAATEQRRPELALARLRGLGARGAAGLLFRELGLVVVGGVVAGGAVGWLVAAAASAAWLQPGVQLEVRLPVFAAVAAAAGAGLLALAAAAAPTLRQPVTSLLRRIPPRASSLHVGLGEGAVAAAAAAGLVTLLSGEGGPVALLAPGLLAVAGGLALAQLTVPVASPAARQLLGRGRIAGGLAGVQIARRPALRRLIAIVTVACALLVFAVDAWSVSARNREARAEFESGASTVLAVDTPTADRLREAVEAIDPEGDLAAPVVVTRSATEAGPVTVSVDPARFRAVARWNETTGRPSQEVTEALSPRVVDALPFPDAPQVDVRVDTSYSVTRLPRPRGLQGELRDVRLAIFVDGSDRFDGYVDLGPLRPGRQVLTGTVACPERCRLRGIVLERTFGDAYPIDVALEVHGVSVAPADGGGGATDLDLGPAIPEAWALVPSSAPSPQAEVVAPGPGEPLILRDAENFQSLHVQRGDVPVVIPALGTGRLPTAFRSSADTERNRVLAPDLSGSDRLYRVIDRLPGLPGGYERAVVVDLGAASGTDLATGARTTYEVWIDATGSTAARVREQLAADGIEVIRTDSIEAQRQLLADEGAALALRLALVAGVVALLLGAAVLMVGVATSGAARARDLAGLRIVGVAAGTVRAAAVAEHVLVAVLGSLVGSALGLVAAQVALPQVPLFATPSATLEPDLSPAWVPVVGTALTCLLLLGVVSVLVGRSLAAAAVPDRVRGAR